MRVKFYFKYEKGKANVYSRSVYGERLIAWFEHGKEAKEYVEWRNGLV